jgi:cation/acetate symporter
LSLVCGFQVIVFVAGLGAAALLVDQPEYSSGGTQLHGGSNLAAIHLARELGGELFMGFIAAVAFATILAVVAGLTLSAAATVSHDLYAQAIRQGTGSDIDELRVSRIAAIVLGLAGVGLAILFEGQNVAVLATLPLAIAASTTFPVLMLSLYWRGLTTRGALAGGYAGMFASVFLVILGPSVWVGALGFDRALFPYAYPTLCSMPLAFLLAWWVSRHDRSTSAEAERAAFAVQRAALQPAAASRGAQPPGG